MKYKLLNGTHQTRQGHVMRKGQVLDTDLDMVGLDKARWELMGEDSTSHLEDLSAPTKTDMPDDSIALPADFDLKQDISAPGTEIHFVFVDDDEFQRPSARSVMDMDAVQKCKATVAENITNHGFVCLYSNDYIYVTLIDAKTGKFRLTDNGRQFRYFKSKVVHPTD